MAVTQNGDESAPESQDATDTDVEAVEGERGVSAVQRPPSLQSRLSDLLAVGLMGSLGIGLLGWYYVHSLGTRSQARQAAQTSARERAKGDVSLRPLGRVDPPTQNSALQGMLGGPPEPPPNSPMSPPSAGPAAYSAATPPAYAVKTPRDLQMERAIGRAGIRGRTVRSERNCGRDRRASRWG